MPYDSEYGKPIDWLNRALGDFRIACNYQPGYYYEDLCYHCQQAVEKAIKAVLIRYGISFIKTHEIGWLLNRLPDYLPLPISKDEASEISEYAVTTRYPGRTEPVTRNDWQQALNTTEKTLNWAKEQIN